MTAARVNLDGLAGNPPHIEQGATYRLGFTHYPNTSYTVTDGVATPTGPGTDFTGCSARMQIRRSLKTPVLVSLTGVYGVVEGDSSYGGITLHADGTIAIVMMDEETDQLVNTTGVYDLEVEFPGGDVLRLLEGAVAVDLNVTRVDA